MKNYLQILAFRVKFALSLLKQIISAVLFLQKHTQVIHFVGHFLGLSLPLSNNLTLLLNLFVSVVEFLFQLFLETH